MSNNTLVFDTEANGLLDEATTVWCAAGVTGEGVKVSFTPDEVEKKFLPFLASFELVVCHNLIGYDLPLLKKIYGYEHKGKVLDTLVLSRLLQPERVGRHSIEAWGERFGIPKPVHEDWSKFSSEMMHRCKQDVLINDKVLTTLALEADMDIEELMCVPTY